MGYAAFDIPGVYARIIDATQYFEVTTPLALGMVGTATKGPLETPTDITTIKEFFNTFGPPTPNSFSYYAAEQFFAYGNLLRFARVESTATPAVAATYQVEHAIGGGEAVLSGISEGTWAHDIDIYITVGSGGAGFLKLDLYYLGALVESYDNIDSVNPDFQTPINGVSEYITASVGGLNIDVPQSGTMGSLLAGDDGLTGIVDGDYIGTIVAGVRTGLQHFRNKRQYPLQLIACPDWPDQQAGDELLQIAQERGDCVALIDAADGLTPLAAGGGSVGAWLTALLVISGDTTMESWGSMTWPWTEIWDAKNNQYVWVPTSGHFAGAIAHNDQVEAPWFAPAGPNRGKLPLATDLRVYLSDDDIRAIYVNSAINPLLIRNGIMINGHRTLQTATTALRYIEVRRALLALRQSAEVVGRNIQFDPNNSRTFRSLEGEMNAVVSALLSSKHPAFRELVFKCNDKMNPSRTKRKHELYAQFYCKPNITADTIILDLVLTAEGMAFSESILT